MTFWAALKESFLEALFGASQLEYWREEARRRAECERMVQKHLEEARRQSLLAKDGWAA